MMRVEVTEKSLRSDGYVLVEGDTLTVPDAIGANWCRYGWAKDTAGQVETGPRVVLDARLTVQPGRLGVSAPSIGVEE
jgi:hypothetical protein